MILFFYGEETYVPTRKIKLLKEKFLKKNPTGSGLVEFDCEEECNINDIVQSFGEQNLFASTKFIIVKDLFANTKTDKHDYVIKALEENNTDDVLVFYERGKVRKNLKLFKWLNKNANQAIEYKPLKDNELETWIQKEVLSRGGTITSGAIGELVLFVGNDLWLLSNEIDKLISFVDDRQIDIEDVHKIVNGKVNSDMFKTIEASISNNKKRAVELLYKQMASGDSPFHIFSMYAYQVRTLLKVVGAMNSGMRDKTLIAKELKLHPFVVQKTITLAQNTSYDKAIKMHKYLTRLDADVKQGKTDIKTGLELFVLM